MQPVIRRSKNRVGGLEMQIKKEPWYKRLFDKILVSCFLSCRHGGKCWKSSGRHMITAVLSTRYADVGVRNAER